MSSHDDSIAAQPDSPATPSTGGFASAGHARSSAAIPNGLIAPGAIDANATARSGIPARAARHASAYRPSCVPAGRDSNQRLMEGIAPVL